MVETVDISFSPWGDGGPKGRMRGRHGRPENNSWTHSNYLLYSRAAPSSACRHLLPGGEKRLAEGSNEF